jgi:trimethylamine--corrinoid protein Co-methyltransferase
VSDEDLALDAFREVGPGNHFFGCAHTLRHYETAFWDSSVADNTSFEQWRDAGATSTDERAAKAWRRLLSEYQPPTIDAGVDEALRDFVTRRKAASEDRWY